MPVAYLSRRAVFSASHRLHSTNLSDTENRELFGKCNHPGGHGHNYVLEVVLRGDVDPQTGILANLSDLKRVIGETVLEKLDHRNLNQDVPEFGQLNPTAENIAIVCWNWLSPLLPALYEVRLRETENNVAVYRGEVR